jgi:hypothetical protein
MTAQQALKAASSEPAVFLGLESEFGTVAVGKRADLLLLDANPPEDVSNLRRQAIDCTGVFECDGITGQTGVDRTFCIHGLQQSGSVTRHRRAYSIRARGLVLQTEAGCMGAICSCDPETQKRLAKRGVHVWMQVIPKNRFTLFLQFSYRFA